MCRQQEAPSGQQIKNKFLLLIIMIKTVINTKKYFQAPKNFFWRWAENGEVIEWPNSSTICYRDELVQILKEISSAGSPPLTALLLILAACKNELNIHHKFFVLRVVKKFKDDGLEKNAKEAIEFLKIISDLPGELRTGLHRAQLIREIFESADFVFSNVQLQELTDELNSGRLDSLILSEGEEISKEQLHSDLHWLSGSLKKFQDTKKLELRLRTGLDEIPPAIEINLPEISTKQLLEQLADDPQTIGVARLTKRLIAALNIPMHAQGSSDQPYGGISDISNRGSFDKLLLSELAYDDLLLTARLVNNEALYFRREEPPDNPNRQRTILIDTSLKMWGIPRVYALSAALAFAHNSKHKEIIEAFALGGETYVPIHLKTKEGIISAMEMLHHSLHCGKALHKIINDIPSSTHNEFILITDEKLISDANFQSLFSQINESLSFIVMVDRNGELHFYECIKGKMKLLSKAKFELDEILFETGRQISFAKTANDELPKYVLLEQVPLLYPQIRINEDEKKFFYQSNLGLLAITENQRLLFVLNRQEGAKELLNNVEEGIYAFGFNEEQKFYLMVYNRSDIIFKLYKLEIKTGKVESIDFSEEITKFPKRVVFQNNKFIIDAFKRVYIYDCEINSFIENEFQNYERLFQEKEKKQEKMPHRFRFNNDNVLTNIKSIFINDAGELSFDKHSLSLLDKQNFKISTIATVKNKNNIASLYEADYRPLNNKRLKFKKFIWHNGSEAVIDSRGLLHLRSSDKTLPEITIIMALAQTTACWASDGNISGADYFMDGYNPKRIGAADFYQKYIKAFIDKLNS